MNNPLRVPFTVMIAAAMSLTAIGTTLASQSGPTTGQAGLTPTTGQAGVAADNTPAPAVNNSGGQAQSTNAQNFTAFGTLLLDLGGATAAVWTAVRGSNNNNNTTTIHATPAPSASGASPSPSASASSIASYAMARGVNGMSVRYNMLGSLNHAWSNITIGSVSAHPFGVANVFRHVTLELNGQRTGFAHPVHALKLRPPVHSVH